MIDFSLPPEHVRLRDRVTEFVRNQVIPMEADSRQSPHGPSEALRQDLVAMARAQGLLSPHAAAEYLLTAPSEGRLRRARHRQLQFRF